MEELKTTLTIFDEAISRVQDMTAETRENMQRQHLQWLLQQENESVGTLTGCDCKVCRNKGYIYYLDENMSRVMRECECMEKRKTISRMHESGLGELLETCTFERYQALEDWKKRAKSIAWDYAQNPTGWLYAGGQTGAGKTHLCTAVCNVLIQKGYNVRYLLWKELVHKLESNKFNDEGYAEIIREIREFDVLYLDDFLKIKDENKIPQMMDFAFEVIDARYISRKMTIISSEYFITEIEAFDAATAGRIYQMAGNNFISIARKPERNYRIQNGGMI